MKQTVIFDKKLISRYNLSGPRYTSYPSAVKFHDGFSEVDYMAVISSTNEDLLPKPLSLYVHLPFCNTVCFYCACNKIITANRKRAEPYLKALEKEIRLQAPLFDYDRKVSQLHWGGGTPTFISNQQIENLMGVIKDNFSLLDDDEGEYSIEIDPREIHEDTIPLLRKIGFNRLSLGVQDFDIEVQKAVNRIQPFEQTLAVIQEARKNRFQSINIDLIYGLPKQTVSSFKKTVDHIIEIDPDRIAIYNYAHLPRLFKPQRQINESDLPSPAEKLEILEQAITLLTKAGYIYIGMDHFAKPDDELAIAQRKGTLYRNFQGYSTNASCDVIGLGVTAISKIGNSYSQNERNIEDYLNSVNEKHIPIFRGYRLNDDDDLRRHVITQLICHFEIIFSEVEDLFKINFNSYFDREISLLNHMQKDGLLEINEDKIEVFPKGRFLIRNICSIFDKYLPEADSTQNFSKMI